MKKYNNNLRIGFSFYEDGSLDYDLDNDDELKSIDYPLLGKTAFETAVPLIASRITELSKVYLEADKNGNKYGDFIKILELISDAINYSGDFLSYSPSNDLVPDNKNIFYTGYINNIVDLTLSPVLGGGSHPSMRIHGVDTNIIPSLLIDCFDKKSSVLRLTRLVTEVGKDGSLLKTDTLKEIQDITQKLIAKAIGLVELEKIGTNDRGSQRYKDAILGYQYFHKYPGDELIKQFIQTKQQGVNYPSASTTKREDENVFVEPLIEESQALNFSS
jgi:hypothetical protein